MSRGSGPSEGNVSLCAVTADTALQRFREERR